MRTSRETVYNTLVCIIPSLALIDAFTQHTALHFPNGVSTVIDTDTAFILIIIGSVLNPSNFYNGRWREVYTIDYEAFETVVCKVAVDVHFYEDGNVRMHCERESGIGMESVQPDAVEYATACRRAILAEETRFQTNLNTAFAGLSESFKSLKRALPLTRTKMDWNNLSNCAYTNT
jgi:capping protein (actin filament) muscle Z-line, alpha